MGCGSNQEKGYKNKNDNRRFACPSDKGIKVPSHPSSNIKEQEKSPSRNTQEAKHIDNNQLIAFSRGSDTVVVPGIDESWYRNGECQNRCPSSTHTDNHHIEDKELKEYECKPVATFQGTKLVEELWRRCQQKQENESWHNLHHKLLVSYLTEWATTDRLEQPTAQHKETRQTEENKHRIIAHSGISQAEMANMCKNYEDHCESSHRIDICYSLLLHLRLQKYRKKTELLDIPTENVIFAQK
jgi:hypothetical protein